MAIENVVIIGSGPSAYTAAVYASRASLNPLIVEGEADQSKRTDIPGGQLMITTDVENYPGFPKGVEGPELMNLMRQQAERFGTRIESGWIDTVDFSKRPFTLKTSEKEYRSNAVIIATGAGAKFLGIPSEKALANKGVSACATCDGALPGFRNKPLAVIGGGDTALEEANFLTRFASRVYVVHRRDQLRCSKIMETKGRKNPKIEFVFNKIVDEIHDVKAGRVTGVSLKDTASGEVNRLDVAGVFVAIGHSPNTAFIKGHLALDEMGYVKVTRGTYTSVEGVFAAGDCVDHVYRQAITAAGMGCMAAIDTERWLETQGH
ncbi:MAG TPA: thioredoxin-disulfide reductase [Planctomycetota bacterium]|nr:thioredoxin-disulfide reductase [Planctomycetota bacterium]